MWKSKYKLYRSKMVAWAVRATGPSHHMCGIPRHCAQEWSDQSALDWQSIPVKLSMTSNRRAEPSSCSVREFKEYIYCLEIHKMLVKLLFKKAEKVINKIKIILLENVGKSRQCLIEAILNSEVSIFILKFVCGQAKWFRGWRHMLPTKQSRQAEFHPWDTHSEVRTDSCILSSDLHRNTK